MIREPINVAQAALLLDCSRQYVHTLRTTGRLRGFRMGKIWILDAGQVATLPRRKAGRPRKA